MASTLLKTIKNLLNVTTYKSEIGIMTNRKNDQLLANKPISHSENCCGRTRKQ